MDKTDIMYFFEVMKSITGVFDFIAPFIFFLLGVSLIYWQYNTKRKFKAIKKIKALGKIIKSEIKEYMPAGSTMLHYETEIEYVYEIEGKEYHSARIAYSTSSFSSNDKVGMKSFINKYSIGSAVDVFVNNSNFEDSYLIEGSPNGWVFTFLGFLFMFASFFIYSFF